MNGHHASYCKARRKSHQGAAMARVDLVAGVAAQVDLHPYPLLVLRLQVHTSRQVINFGLKDGKTIENLTRAVHCSQITRGPYQKGIQF